MQPGRQPATACRRRAWRRRRRPLPRAPPGRPPPSCRPPSPSPSPPWPPPPWFAAGRGAVRRERRGVGRRLGAGAGRQGRREPVSRLVLACGARPSRRPHRPWPLTRSFSWNRRACLLSMRSCRASRARTRLARYSTSSMSLAPAAKLRDSSATFRLGSRLKMSWEQGGGGTGRAEGGCDKRLQRGGSRWGACSVPWRTRSQACCPAPLDAFPIRLQAPHLLGRPSHPSAPRPPACCA